jgi:DNA-binding phage protein
MTARRKPPPQAPAPRLKALVESSGRSIRSVAAEVGIHHTNLLDILGGQTDPRVTTVARILRALGKSWSDIDG